MAYTLLVWELVPEEIKMYLIPNEVANTYRDFLDDAHGKIINHHKETDGLRFLNNALSNEKTDAQNDGWDDDDFNQYRQYRGIFLKYEVKMGSPIKDTHITAVYHSGFAL